MIFLLPKNATAETFLLRKECSPYHKVNNDTIDRVLYYGGANSKESCLNILRQLKQEGIKSILIEGGSKTISSFLSADAIDWLQFHIAPILFGSGIPTVELSVIDSVQDCLILDNMISSTIGDHIMCTGEPIKTSKNEI